MISTTVYGEIHGETWEGFSGSLPFTIHPQRNRGPLLGQLRKAITGDFKKETVWITGAAHVTSTVTKGRVKIERTKRYDLAYFPSLKEVLM